jgi:hypothetical protein
MLVTKNVFYNIIGTLLDMPRKMKDGLKSPNGKYYLPPASYSLTIKEKKHLISACMGCKYPQVSHPTSPN